MLLKSEGRMLAVAVLVAAALAGCARAPKPKTPQPLAAPSPLVRILPAPLQAELRPGPAFEFTALTPIVASPGPAVTAARDVALLVKRSSGLALAVSEAAPAGSGPAVTVSLGGAPMPDEGYELTIGDTGVTLRASAPAGLSYGVQTIRQLLPYWDEDEAILYRKPRPVSLPALHIVDAPRYAWRGAMLDVARHFFTVDDVKRYIDLLALHKLNRLHLHLADDQGWRIEIKSRPNLTQVGAATEVGGGPGGFYTQQQYADLVAYAAARFVTIVPEIDMPGHTNAALASYAELNCDGTAAQPYFGTEVGFSAFCVESEATYRFIDDVVGEIARITPGAYFHAGGDEVKRLTPEQYATFVTRVQQIVAAHGKQMVGWDEIAAVALLPTSIVQHWRPKTDLARLARAPHLLLSPGDRTYIDMKYDERTALGLNWAGLVSVRQAYDWDPATIVPGVNADIVLGIEAPLWSETLTNIRDVEFLAFPRLAAIADVGWSPAATHDWEAFRARLGEQAPRWTALGINFYRAPEIAWRAMAN